MPPSPLTRLLRALPAAAFVATGAAGAAVHAQPLLRLNDDRGHLVELREPARRIIALAPSLTETVCALGACDRLVGVDRYSNWPQAVQPLPRVGTMDTAQIEAIVALRPDLVLVRPRSRVADQLERLGIRVLALDARTHADMRRVMETVARAIGRPGAGEAAWQRLDAGLDAARARMPPSWRGRKVYFELHGAAAASDASFIGETLTRLGLVNVVPASYGAFPKISPEFVVRAQPDLLIAPQLSDLQSMASRPGWSALDAIRQNRTCSFAGERFDLIVRPGPRLDEAADEIVRCLQAMGK